MRLARRVLLAGGTGLALCGTGGCAAPGRALIAADTHPEGYPTVEAVRAMGRTLIETSGGRLGLAMFAGGQLGEERDTLELTMMGGIDVNRVNLSPLNGIAPETLVPSLPFLFDDAAHMRRAMDGPPGRAILAALAPHGLAGLAFYDSGARSFYSRRGAIRSPVDLAGQKIRVPGSDLFVATVAALGGVAVPMNYGEVYQGILQGVIDGAENNVPSFESSRHFEAAPHFSPTEHVMAPEVVVMSMHRWRRLAEGDQALVRAAARASVEPMRRTWEAREADARQRLEAAGVLFVGGVQREAFRRRVAPVWDRFLTTPALRQLTADIRAMA